jgi:hypothetical protein
MNERVKMFTFVSGHGATLLDPALEDTINRWLANNPGELVQVSQSESERAGVGCHVTVCLWYVPQEPAATPG